jgi:DNA-binding Lrp family transcriptional regulator
MYSLDNIDRQLIGLLRSNAREPVARLATTIGVSRATVQNRIDKLEKKGVITGYTTLI